MSGAANAARGARAELAVVNYLKANGFPEARRSGRGFKGSDVLGVPFSVEVKDRARSAWPSWRAQAVADAGPGQTVVVVRRVRGVSYPGSWDCHWTEWRMDGVSGWAISDLGAFMSWWKEQADVA